MTKEMEEQIRRVLKRAAGIVLKGWCQDDSAVDENGDEVASNDPAACRWCAAGAIELAVVQEFQLPKIPLSWGPAPEDEVLGGALRWLQDEIADPDPDWCIGDWNDEESQTARKVANALRRASRQ